ncbi:AlpA family transcriptional regulator [Thiomonas sp. CB2]|uniref:helix-turn-helix transcriptional regulator n=1 Tax=Thiomonas sp. CB2 TaxID=554131 RepID=UPI001E2C7376|nr:AlpA family transcriptional regulator [Thiomonas sp. CB2]
MRRRRSNGFHRNRMEIIEMHEIPTASADRLLRLPEVESLVGLRKSAIYARLKTGEFPPCVKLGPRAAAWPESEIQAWIADRIRLSRRGSA